MLGAIIGGGAGLLGSLWTNQTNQDINSAQMNWQTSMRDTAVQARAADMRKAGINPILAAGNPAAQPSMSPIAMQNPGAAATQGAAAGAAAAATSAQVANIQADTNVKAAQAAQITNATYGKGQFERATEASISKDTSSAANLDAQREQIAVQINKTNQEISNLQSQKIGTDLTNEQMGTLQQGLIELQKLDIQAKRLGLKVTGAEAGAGQLIGNGLDAIQQGTKAAASWAQTKLNQLLDYFESLKRTH